MDPTGMVGLDRSHPAECYAGFRLSLKGLVYSVSWFDIEVTDGWKLQLRVDLHCSGDLGNTIQPAVRGHRRFIVYGLLVRHTFQRWARTPFDRRFVVLVVALIHHDGLQIDFLRRWLLAQITDGDLSAETALNETIVVAAP